MTVENTKRKDVAYDTNVILNLMEKPNVAGMLTTHGLLGGANVYITDIVRKELAEKKVDIKDVCRELEARGATVILDYIEAGMRDDARDMEGKHSMLHYPDSLILAYVMLRWMCLVTCDKGLAGAAEREGVDVVNPDTMCNPDGRFPSKYDAEMARHCRRTCLDGHWTRRDFRSESAPSSPSNKRRRTNLKRRAAPCPRRDFG